MRRTARRAALVSTSPALQAGGGEPVERSKTIKKRWIAIFPSTQGLLREEQKEREEEEEEGKRNQRIFPRLVFRPPSYKDEAQQKLTRKLCPQLPPLTDSVSSLITGALKCDWDCVFHAERHIKPVFLVCKKRLSSETPSVFEISWINCLCRTLNEKLLSAPLEQMQVFFFFFFFFTGYVSENSRNILHILYICHSVWFGVSLTRSSPVKKTLRADGIRRRVRFSSHTNRIRTA